MIPGGMSTQTRRAGVSEYNLKRHMNATERVVITMALTATHGNRWGAAKLLGICVRTLYYRMKSLGLT
jgi:transcriptional regulator with PAS, ATPase and Fis domain